MHIVCSSVGLVMKTVPVICASCNREGTLVVERVANTTRMVVRCLACDDVREVVERRATLADRRKRSRTDRRRQS
jgi:hypothetical protein